MSAWILSDIHINAILTAYKETWKYRHCSKEHKDLEPSEKDLTTLGQMLVDENYKSINCRYEEKTEARTFKFKKTKLYSPIQIWVFIDCYEYQTCEHEGWKTSDAKKFLDKIREEIIAFSEEADKAMWVLDEKK